MIRSNGGWDSFKIMIIKELNCNSKIEMLIEEDKMMKELKSTLNNNRAHLIDEEKAEYYKQYNLQHKVEKAVYNKQYNIEHKVEQAEYDKQRNIIQHKCGCGGCFKMKNKPAHLRTKKHINYIATTDLVLTV